MVNIEQSSYETRENSSEVILTLTLSQVSSELFEVILTTINITATGKGMNYYQQLLSTQQLSSLWLVTH